MAIGYFWIKGLDTFNEIFFVAKLSGVSGPGALCVRPRPPRPPRRSLGPIRAPPVPQPSSQVRSVRVPVIRSASPQLGSARHPPGRPHRSSARHPSGPRTFSSDPGARAPSSDSRATHPVRGPERATHPARLVLLSTREPQTLLFGGILVIIRKEY